MSWLKLTALLAVVVCLGVAGLACGGAEESEYFGYAEESAMADYASDGVMAQSTSARSSDDMAMEKEMAMMSSDEDAFEMETAESMDFEDAASTDFGVDSSGPVAQPVSQQRMIVRSAEVSIEVEDVEEGLARIAALASELGGWVVSSEESLAYTGYISVRVPADRLDSAISRLRSMATDVMQVLVSSRDVTDEYVDNRARLTNLQATADALRALLKEDGRGGGRPQGA